MVDRGYALDMGWPVRHVVTELERSADAGLSVSELARRFEPSRPDLVRIKRHEGCDTDAEAVEWLMRTALGELWRYVAVDSDTGHYRLSVPVEKVRWDRRRVHPIVTDEDGSLDTERAIRAAYNQMKLGAAFSVQVEGARGSVKERRLKLHRLARMLPLIPEKEFTELVNDVRANGFVNPVHLIGDEVLDGRHRVAVATVLGVPLRAVEFTGDEDDARHFVISTNLRRRHLTTPQRTQLARELILPEVAEEAAKRTGGRPRKDEKPGAPPTPGSSEDAESTSPKKRNKKASEIAAERSGGLATARNIEDMAPVDKAPVTRARVMSGEIKTVPEARREALKEIGSDEPEKRPAQTRGTWDSLGRAKYWAGHALKAQREGVGLGKHSSKALTADDHRKRLDEIRVVLDEYEAGL